MRGLVIARREETELESNIGREVEEEIDFEEAEPENNTQEEVIAEEKLAVTTCLQICQEARNLENPMHRCKLCKLAVAKSACVTRRPRIRKSNAQSPCKERIL